jgi:hypothetical protein
MTLPVAVAEQILRRRFGEPAKTPTQYVSGFRTATGRVLGLHRDAPNLPAINFRITDELNLGQGSETQKFNDNIAATNLTGPPMVEKSRWHPCWYGGSRGMEYSVPNSLPYILTEDPDPFDTVENLERHLAELQAMPAYQNKASHIIRLKGVMAIKKRHGAERKAKTKE